MSLPPAYDSIKELGVYDTLPADIKNQLPNLVGLPESVQLKALEAMQEEAGKDEIKNELLEEIKQLAGAAKNVDEAFERVRVGLGQVDNNNYTDSNGKPIGKFQPTWTGYQNANFNEIILPIVEDIQNADDLADARLDLDAFIKRNDPYENSLNSQETIDAAMKYSQAFTDLRRNLEAFQGTFDSFAKEHEINLGQDITNKQAQIEVLQLEIKQCQTVVMAMSIALGVTLFVTVAGAVGSLAALGPLGPFVAIGIAIVGALAAISEMSTLIAYVVKTNEKKAELDEAERQLRSLQEQLETLKQLRSILMNQKSDITYISGRLDRFAVIWNIIRHDAQIIRELLDAAVGDEGSKKAFKLRVDLVKKSYEPLQQGMREYATSVRSFTEDTQRAAWYTA
ncbi:hypothetical protein M422DRAFT_250194 [Sphaerobolus stellatus SS14]|uniref:Uncharacterized protein n=1 Tax=Sphaerobolus stellatus (strain SS14) TaxID=990650 RepID=A0A0C9VGJ4_SPHS4|nr:hypothetical protein M422DRAFT_250194 [Sphaerobolus stellatus SS14]